MRRLVIPAAVLATAALLCIACADDSAPVGGGDSGVPDGNAADVSYDLGAGDATLPSEGGLPLPPADSIAILVDPTTVLHAASSHVLAANRNHVEGDITAKDAKLAKMTELKPTWGGAEYLYRIGSDPTDGRTDITAWTGYHFEDQWGQTGPYPYDDLRNAMADATTMGAGTYHVVNFGTGTPEEAGRYVSYLNNADDATRAGHGLSAWNAQYFQIGSKPGWSLIRGHDTYAATEGDYANRALTFAQAMRASSDVPILVGAVVSIDSRFTGDGWGVAWMMVSNILQTMGNDVDFLVFHGYPSAPVKDTSDLRSYMAQNSYTRLQIETVIKPAITNYATHPVFLVNAELNTQQGTDPGRARGLFGALYSADSILTAMVLDIRAAVQFSFSHEDLADSSFFIGNDVTKVTPTFRLHKMLASSWGDDIVQSVSQNMPTYDLPDITTEKLGYVAAKGSDGKVYVLVLNRTADETVGAWVHPGFLPSASRCSTLAGSAGWDSGWSQVDVTDSEPDVTQPLVFAPATVSLLVFTP
jgi:hypothetical protein